ncbi:MAG TPA: glycosyltransferase family 4 protein [Phycisphaerales bacterium]|nr:glycosyltransferase family 4 protein [Phycisphaerales bacterium]
MSFPSVLFLTPNFLARRLHKSIRGVEVFDLLFIRQLVELGVPVTVAAESSWRERFPKHWAGAMPEMLWTPSLRKPLPNALAAAALNGSRRHDVLLLGNNGRGLLPATKLLHKCGRIGRTLLIAHRLPRDDYVRAIRGFPMDVLAISEAVVVGFREKDGSPVHRGWLEIYYGLPNYKEFSPRTTARKPDEPVKFCLLGKMDSPDKGAAGAMAAFSALPDDVRRRCELHLASYQTPPPPAQVPEGVLARDWMPATAIAEFLRGMDALIVNSKYESFSQAAVQAMLTGIPVITVPLPAVVEKVVDGAGIVVKDQDELTGAMATLAGDEALRARMGETARRVALEKYIWDTGEFVERFLKPSATSATNT